MKLESSRGNSFLAPFSEAALNPPSSSSVVSSLFFFFLLKDFSFLSRTFSGVLGLEAAGRCPSLVSMPAVYEATLDLLAPFPSSLTSTTITTTTTAHTTLPGVITEHKKNMLVLVVFDVVSRVSVVSKERSVKETPPRELGDPDRGEDLPRPDLNTIRLKPEPETSIGTSSGGYFRERARTRCSGEGSLWAAGSFCGGHTLAGTEGDTGDRHTSVRVSSSEHHSRRATKLAGCKS
ncbi:hypothetical protein E2C01_011359 [Portunus trituberculatus]|uniref:Uncharacterized protein n=1 Tax=Portunus trituberculatus TaxID=210409 RepID=A0A5B7DAW1_PORTR|nr:hypothetical protein [Portunus trituberculatus]